MEVIDCKSYILHSPCFGGLVELVWGFSEVGKGDSSVP